MPFETFLDLTPKEFFDVLYDKEEHEKDIILAQVRTICDTIRLQTYHLVNVQLSEKKKIRDSKQLMKFEWDKPKPTQTAEDMKKVMKAIARNYKGKGKQKDDANRKRRNR